jgi:acetyltransferase-like isoleucine patch superfamily enzyme
MIRILRYFRLRLMRCLYLLKIILLRIAGVKVDWSAVIDWSAAIERSGGEISIGRDTLIDRGVILRAYGGVIQLGSQCRVNPYVVLYGDGGLVIGNGVRIAAHAVLVAANHIYSDPNRFIFEQGETRLGINIEDDVWLGAGVRVLDGVTIRKGTVVGAGAVVTKSTEPYDVVVGVPAKKLRSRKDLKGE